MTKVLVDENLSEYFADGLHKIQFPLENDIEVTSIAKEFYKGIKDEDWIPKWGQKNGIFITQDLNIHKTRHQAAMLGRYSLGAFFVKVPKSYRYWDKVTLLIDKWLEIVNLIEKHKRPFAFEITPRKIERINL